MRLSAHVVRVLPTARVLSAYALSCPLYRHQAQRLVRELSKVQVRAQSNQRLL